MKTVELILQELESLIQIFTTYKNLSNEQWNKPISEGKWSPSQIVSHICAWDEILITDILPSLVSKHAIQFPDTQMINSEAAQFAKTMSQDDLLEQSIQTRTKLVQAFRELPNIIKDITFTMNGYEQHPKTGESFTLVYLLADFSEHDLHHTDQIQSSIESTM